MTLRSRRFVWQFVASLVLVAGLLLHAGGIYPLRPLLQLDAALYDLKLRLFQTGQMDERIVIADIDEKSLKEIGRWPWPRDQMATLTDNLFQQYGVAALGFDVIFAEPDQSSGLPVLEQLARGALADDGGFRAALERVRGQLDFDARLAAALTGGPTVLGYYFGFDARQNIVGVLPDPMPGCDQAQHHRLRPLQASGYNGNLAQLQAQTAHAGFFNAYQDFDGVIRRMPMLIAYDGRCYASLSLGLLRAGMGIGALQLRPPQGMRPATLVADAVSVPLDGRGMALVPYRRTGSFAYVSAADIIAGRVPAALLEGRIVLVGSTAPGLLDLRVTPMAKGFPGVEIHANLLAGMLDGNVKWEPARQRLLNVLAVLLPGLLLAALLPWLTPLWAAGVTLAWVAGLMAVDLYAWQALDLSLAPAVPVATVVALFVLNMAWGFFVEARSKAQITRLFGQYVPPELVDEMAKDPARYSLRGESRVMSVLFSDIVGFTSISERLDAAELAQMLNVYLSAMTRVIQDGRGTIDKYIGDAIMAFWGAPTDQPDHARRALLAARDMEQTLLKFREELGPDGEHFDVGIGINSGEAVVGFIGSPEHRQDYTVIGDTVNTASRIEGATKGRARILVSEATRNAVGPGIGYKDHGLAKLKGKGEEVHLYEPLWNQSTP